MPRHRNTQRSVFPVVFWLALGGASGCAAVLGLERGELAPSSLADDAASPAVDERDGGAAYSASVIGDEPLAYYPFEELAGASRVVNRVLLPSPRERDGVVEGAALGAAGARGVGDRAMTGSAVVLSWRPIPTGNEPFSLEVALRARRLAAGGVIVAHDGYRVVADGADLVFERSSESVRAPGAIAVDRWIHAAVTFDGGRLRLLVGGVVADEIRTTQRVGGTEGPLTIGSATFDGLVDELAIYAREVATDLLATHAALLR